MLNFSTDELHPGDRFDHWCEVRGKSLFGVTIELERARRASFQGRFQARGFGGAVLSEMQASSYQVMRTPKDIARLHADSLMISHQVRGPGWLDLGAGGTHTVSEGDFAISYSDQPFAATPMRTDGFQFRTIKIPVAPEILLGAKAHDLSAATINPGASFLRPLAAMFSAIMRGDLHHADPQAEIAHLARLAMLARGRLVAGMPESRAALRAGFLHAARDIMRNELHQATLSPTAVARQLGISLRHVHVLFEPTGQTFARTLTTMRLDVSRRLLETMPNRSVLDIAYSCGFDSLATFYRVFKAAYGMAPGDLRAHVAATAIPLNDHVFRKVG